MQSAKFIETAIIIDGSNYQDLLDKGNIPHDADETGKGCYARILLVPKSDDYFKTLIACCVDLLTRLLRENLKAETPFLSKVQMLGRFIGYFFNCDSYEKQEFQDYDVRELKARIRKVL